MNFLTAEQAKLTMDNLSFHENIEEAVQGVDMVIESVPENVGIKTDIFSKLDKLVGPEVILASNTSSLNIYEFLKVSHPERLIITHFFVPAYVMPLVEIVCGPQTSEQTIATVKEMMDSAGKKPAVLKKVIPGFIMNRLTFALFREAMYMIDQGWCTAEDVDNCVVATHGPRYAFEGPCGLVDMAGVETYTKISEYLLPELCASGDVPKCLSDLLASGKRGVMNGQGFYTYPDIAKARNNRSNRIIKNIMALAEVSKEFE